MCFIFFRLLSQAAAVKLEMAELFETMANRPGVMMQFETAARTRGVAR